MAARHDCGHEHHWLARCFDAKRDNVAICSKGATLSWQHVEEFPCPHCRAERMVQVQELLKRGLKKQIFAATRSSEQAQQEFIIKDEVDTKARPPQTPLLQQPTAQSEMQNGPSNELPTPRHSMAQPSTHNIKPQASAQLPSRHPSTPCQLRNMASSALVMPRPSQAELASWVPPSQRDSSIVQDSSSSPHFRSADDGTPGHRHNVAGSARGMRQSSNADSASLVLQSQRHPSNAQAASFSSSPPFGLVDKSTPARSSVAMSIETPPQLDSEARPVYPNHGLELTHTHPTYDPQEVPASAYPDLDYVAASRYAGYDPKAASAYPSHDHPYQ